MIRAEEKITLTRVDDGSAGKSAYDSAVDGGYTGSEENFNTDLADISHKANQDDLDSTNEEVSKKSDLFDYYDIIYRLDGGKYATVTVGQGTSFSVDDISIIGDIYTKYFEGVESVSFYYSGTVWNVSNDGTNNGHQLDEYGISLSDDVTPVAGDTFTISFGTDIGGLFEKVDEFENGLNVYSRNTIALTSDVAQLANNMEVFNKSIILNPGTPEITVRARNTEENINNEVTITPTKIAFEENGNETASISNEKLFVTNEYITNYYPRVYQNGEWLGDLGFIARVNGHLSLKYVKSEVINGEGTITVQEVT